jgi:hypothetical protein
MRKRTILLWIAAIFLALGGWFYHSLTTRELHVRLRQRDIDAILIRQFPIEKTHLKVVRITYSDPSVTFVPQSNQLRIGIKAKIRAGIKPFEKEYQTGISLLCGLSYNSKKKKLFLTNALCEEFDLPLIPENYREITKQALNLTSITCFEEIPVYELKPRNKYHQVASMVLRDLEVKDDSLTFTLKLPENAP